jgi:uncharacterized protein (DUF302 family)
MILEESVLVTEPFHEVLPRVKELLAEQGFGTLTEIDVQATMQAKLGREMGCYVIVGACNPRLASQALDAEPQIGVLLPCNVVVRETDRGVLVEAMDPGVMAKLVDREPIHKVADEARRLIGDALSRLSAGS